MSLKISSLPKPDGAPFNCSFGGRLLNVILRPENSVYDAAAYFAYPGNNDPGMGDFDVRGFRISAPSYVHACRYANELIRLEYTPRDGQGIEV